MYLVMRKLRGVTGISLIWALAWAVLFTTLTFTLQLFLPFDGDVGSLRMMYVIGGVGLVSGCIFSLLLATIESGKTLHDLSLGRVTVWGSLSAAVYPVLTGRANQVFWTCAFGALVAFALIAVARRAARNELTQSQRLLDGLFCCALLPMRDVLAAANKSVR